MISKDKYRVQVTMSIDLFVWLDDLAKKERVTKSELIVWLLTMWREELEKLEAEDGTD